jgi:DNA helicase II / ATP-dependent DNA helicase PcrA
MLLCICVCGPPFAALLVSVARHPDRRLAVLPSHGYEFVQYFCLLRTSRLQIAMADSFYVFPFTLLTHFCLSHHGGESNTFFEATVPPSVIFLMSQCVLLTGWELLVTYPDLLNEIQKRYQYVLVDEFQDINYAQAEILDLLTQPHRNYMAIGDDDQTVYEWRGAAPSFILDFPKRYQAQTYVIDENFRCPAGALTLANEVIRHNRKRQPKRLHLTRGFGGEATLTFNPSLEAMAEAMATQILQLRQNGVSLDEIAVLVRLNAQTPLLEQALIVRQIPYRSASPFYKRPEVQTLVQYGRLAWAEKQLLAGHSLGEGALTQALQAWRHIVNRPKRYISTDLRRRMTAVLLQGQQPWSQTVTEFSQLVDEEWLQDKLQKLAQDMRWLAENLDQDASQTLRELEVRLQYKQFLQTTSGLAQTGSDRAAGVDALIAYAAGHSSLQAFFGHIRQLEQERAGLASDSTSPAVTLSTIHRAKGLEWPYVFIPECNQGTLPFTGQEPVNLEEERRLFYVALTRTQHSVYLFAVRGEQVSQFLLEGKWQQILHAVKDTGQMLRQPPVHWRTDDFRTLARNSLAYQWQSYFRDWWDGPEIAQTTIEKQIAALSNKSQTQAARKTSPTNATDILAAQPDKVRGTAKIIDEGKYVVKIELDGQVYTWNKRINSWYNARYFKPPENIIRQLESCLDRFGLR